MMNELVLSLSLAVTVLCTDYSTKCSISSCDTVSPVSHADLPSRDSYVLYQTSQDGDRLKKYTGNTFSQDSNGGWQHITLDPSQTFQTIVGFGGALTDAAAITINKLKDPKLQESLLSSYYTDSGLEYSLGRIPIASTDFSTQVYSYNDVEEDYELAHFSIDVDKSATTGFKTDFIQRVIKMSKINIKFFASPWAPPAWMTKTNSTVGNPSLRDDPRIHQAWALYFSKFLEAYRQLGVDFWGLTVQNEPVGNLGTWQDLKMTPEEQRDFVSHYLGPHLKATFPEVKIMMLDDQRVNIPQWSDTVLADSVANNYIDGIALHWYASVDDYLAWLRKPFAKMNAVHDRYSDKFLLATEACNGYIPIIDQGPKLGSWNRGERYGFDILHDLNAWAVGWTDWNIALDMTGGPNWAKNNVDAPILVDTDAGDVFYKNPMWYYLGHFSKFIPQGSQRIGLKSTAPILNSPMEATGFLTPEGRIVIVVLNRGIAGHKFNIAVAGGDRGYINLDIPKHSIQTVIFDQ